MPEPAALWHPSAAYLYVLRLDGPGLAWEYLRRHPDYARGWRAHRSGADVDPDRWGLCRFEDPDQRAPDFQPDWVRDPADTLQVQPSLARSADDYRFGLWQLPGHKRIEHDGHRVRLVAQFASCVLRLALAPTIEDGLPIAGAIAIDEVCAMRWRAAQSTLRWLTNPRPIDEAPTDRPGRGSVLNMRSLQALDGASAGASMRQIAVALFGECEAYARWHAESELRAHVRYLVHRGRRLMHGGYHRLLHPGRRNPGENEPPALSP